MTGVTCPRCGATVTEQDELEFAPAYGSSRRRCPGCDREQWVEVST